MKCPYCAQTIGTDAIMCPFCQNNIAVFKPISEKLSQLENAMKMILDMKKLGSNPAAIVLTMALAMSVFLAFLFQWISWQEFAGNKFDWLWHFLSGASPFVAALWLGTCWGHLRPYYLVVGFLAGVGGFLQMFLLYLSYVPQHWPPNWLASLCIYPVSGVLLFLSGRTLGEKIRGKRDPFTDSPKSDSPSNLAIYIPALLGFAGTVVAGYLGKR